MLYLMCGLAFAGKSTVAAAIARRLGAAVVRLDDINLQRGLHGGLGVPAAEWARTHELALREVERGLAAGRSVVVDDTNCFRFLRDDYRAVAGRLGARTVLVHVDVPLELAMSRARVNGLAPIRPVVTDEVMLDLAGKFEMPQPDEETLVYLPGQDLERWVAANIPPRGTIRA